MTKYKEMISIPSMINIIGCINLIINCKYRSIFVNMISLYNFNSMSSFPVFSPSSIKLINPSSKQEIFF